MSKSLPITNKDDEKDDGSTVITFDSLFTAYSNFGPNSDEKNVQGILLSQADLWMKQAKIIGDCVTLTDTGMLFNKFKKRRLTLHEFDQFLIDLCETKKMNVVEVREKLLNAGMPTLAPKMS